MWEKEISIARNAAYSAGNILNTKFGNINRIAKKGEIDLVTDADIQAEKAIIEVIYKSFRNDSILSEEMGLETGSSDRTWIVDPLDGTTNFAHGFPFFSVSIALEVQGEIVLGIVFNPYFNEFFESSSGAGARLNGKSISVSKIKALGDALLSTGFPYSIHKNPETVLLNFKRMISKAQGNQETWSSFT